MTKDEKKIKNLVQRSKSKKANQNILHAYFLILSCIFSEQEERRLDLVRNGKNSKPK